MYPFQYELIKCDKLIIQSNMHMLRRYNASTSPMSLNITKTYQTVTPKVGKL
jgi:hypothetical protein